MAQKFLTNVELEAGLVDGSNSTGTSGYLLSSTGTATSWVDPAAVSVGESEQVHIACKNTSGVAISKGDPVYITGTVGTSFKIQIAKADASDSAKMPAVGLAETDLANNAEGFVIVSGVLKNLTTDPLSTSDGTPSSNDTVYVKEGGGLTRTKPTGSGNLIQNVGKVGRVNSANAGSLAVSTIMRTNDVPNLTTGKIWVGSNTNTTESTVVHLDETNGRMGIGTTNPGSLLHVRGNTTSAVLQANQTGTGVIANFKQAGSSKLLIDNSGNVGIGTTSPSQKLEVAGKLLVDNGNLGSIAGDTIYHAEITGQRHHLDFKEVRTANGSDWPNTTYKLQMRVDTTNHQSIDFVSDANAQEHIDIYTNNQVFNTRFDANGNVGIGTTSPGSKLDVSSSSTSIIRLSNSDAALTEGQKTGSLEFYQSDTSGNGTGVTGRISMLSAKNGGNQNYYGNAADMIFQVAAPAGFASDNATLNALTIKNSSGYVGIGTTSPARKLTVNGSANVFYSLLVNSDTPITGASTYAELVIQAKGNQAGTIRSSQWYFQTLPDSIYGNSGFRIAKNYDGGATSEFMRITSAGNVGIGTTSPQARLDVQPTASNRKVTRIANDVMSTYFYNTQADAVLAWTCGSYYQAEVVITANQTNSGDYNNLYIRGIWSNNHTSHNWDELERVGFLTGSTFTMSVGQNGATQNSGRLELDFDYTSGSFSQLNVRVTDFYGTHSYTIT